MAGERARAAMVVVRYPASWVKTPGYLHLVLYTLRGIFRNTGKSPGYMQNTDDFWGGICRNTVYFLGKIRGKIHGKSVFLGVKYNSTG